MFTVKSNEQENRTYNSDRNKRAVFEIQKKNE